MNSSHVLFETFVLGEALVTKVTFEGFDALVDNGYVRIQFALCGVSFVTLATRKFLGNPIISIAVNFLQMIH